VRSRLVWFSTLLLAAVPAWAQFTQDTSGASPTPAIRDIRPPLDVFPYPTWMVATAAAIGAVIVALLSVAIIRAMRNRPKTPPPTAREIALRRLNEAGADIERIEPYAFSIRVSDILRQYISAQYNLHAPEQTSQEFLAEAAKSPHFTGADKDLLADFLERCDLIKFAHVNATTDDSRGLLAQAVRFVDGSRAVQFTPDFAGARRGAP
jgi:hypothetical protein